LSSLLLYAIALVVSRYLATAPTAWLCLASNSTFLFSADKLLYVDTNWPRRLCHDGCAATTMWRRLSAANMPLRLRGDDCAATNMLRRLCASNMPLRLWCDDCAATIIRDEVFRSCSPKPRTKRRLAHNVEVLAKAGIA
jgi:hypothetical protein